MLRLLLILGLLITITGLMFGCDNDTIVDPMDNQTPSFPNTVGSWWQYSLVDSTNLQNIINDTITVTVTGQKELPSGVMAKVWLVDSDTGVDSIFVEDAGDTVRIFMGHYSDPTAFLFPLTVGNEWLSSEFARDTSWVIDSSLWSLLSGPMTLAFKVERHWATAGYIEEDEFWLIPEIGIVAMTLHSASAIEDEPALNMRWLLLSYNIEN